MYLIRALALTIFCYGVSSNPTTVRQENLDDPPASPTVAPPPPPTQAPTPSTPAPTPPPSPAPNTTLNGYVTVPLIGRHKLHLLAKTWEDARVTCLNEGAHLAVLKSAEEEAIIIKRIGEFQLDEVWLGIHEQFKKDDWVTVQDQRLDSLGFVHWREGEPNNFQDKGEHCVTITQLGWNDLNCNTTKAFLCKIG